LGIAGLDCFENSLGARFAPHGIDYVMPRQKSKQPASFFKRDWADSVYRLISTSHFPLVYDAESEDRKVNVARILVGAIALIRTVLILAASFFYFPPFNLMDFWVTAPQEAWAGLIMCGLWIMFTLGFLTPLASIALLIFYNQFDFMLATNTLGTNVLTLLMLYFLFANAGRQYSLDARLLAGRGPTWLQKIAGSLYGLLGSPDKRQLTIYKFVLFSSYALMSLGAIQFHLRDSYWLSGQTISVLLTNSYLSRFYEAFRWLQGTLSQPYLIFSKISGFFQTIYQIAMIPLMWLKPGKYFVVLWGLGFFLISAIGLQLSYLPFLELVLWAICFAQVSLHDRVAVLYDDYCNLCKRTVQFLNAINFIEAFEFLPLSKNSEVVKKNSLSFDKVQANIHAIKNGRIFVGYDFYKVITRVHPLLFPFYPLLELGSLTRLGPRIYKYIADRRKELFGVCKVSFDVNKVQQKAPKLGPQRRVASNFYIGFTLVSWLLYVSTFAVFTPIRAFVPPIPRSINYLYEVGLVTPNVFNSADLAMGDQWYIIYEELGDGRSRRLPLNGLDGEREFLHTSDLLYFGNSLRWRRGMRAADLVQANQPGTQGYDLIYRMTQFFYRLSDHVQPVSYRIEIYQNRSSDVSVIDAEQRFEAQLVYEYKLVISPGDVD
jgi:predicted DCC family thiol-disulfide oxidoreductase YuxK